MQRIHLVNENNIPDGAILNKIKKYNEYNEGLITATVDDNRGQYIRVENQQSIPTGAEWRGHDWAEIEIGMGKYIRVENQQSIPTGAEWRGHNWAEIEVNRGEYLNVSNQQSVPQNAEWRGYNWAEVIN